MFEAFSTRAKRILFLARLQAGHSGVTEIGVDHLLAALAIEDQGDFDGALREMLIHNRPSSGEQIAVLSGNLRHSLCSIKGDENQTCCPVWEKSASQKPFLNRATVSELLRQVRSSASKVQVTSFSLDLPISTDLEGLLNRASNLANEFEQPISPLHLLAAALELGGAAVEVLHRTAVTYESVVEALRVGKSQ